MKNPFKRHEDSQIDSQITAVLDEMSFATPDSEAYPKLLGYLERLHDLKTRKRREPVSRDTLAIIAGNLMGTLLIVAYEQKHVITSKALPQLIRPRAT